MGFMDSFTDFLANGPQSEGRKAGQVAVDERKQRIQQSAEDHDKAMGDYMDAIGAQPVQSGMVHRQMFTPPVNMGDYSDIPGISSPGQVPATSGYVLDKADPSRIVTHKTADGQTVQWERPTIEQQQLRQARLKLAELQNPQNRESQQVEDTRQANRAGAVAESTAVGTETGRQSSLNAARQQYGVALPEGSGVADGQKFLPEELPGVVQGIAGATGLPAQIQQGQLARASQSLGSVTTPGAYKVLYDRIPDAIKPQFDSPDQFDPQKSPMRARMATMSPADQQKTSLLMNMKPEEWSSQVDAAYPVTGANAAEKANAAAQNRSSHLLVDSYVRQGEFDKARAVVEKGNEQQGKTITAVAGARATAPIKVSVNAQEAGARQNAQLAASGMTEDDFQRAGEQYAISGVMPPMGMGSAARGKIQHYAQEFARQSGMSPRDLAVAQAAFAGDKESLKKFQGQRDQIASFESTATKNLDLFLDAASKIPDTGSPWLNAPLRSLDQSVVGSANMAAVNAARQVANNEIAKVTSGGGLSGVLSDSARHEVEAYNPQNATFKQTIAVAKVLKQDMANRKASMDATLGEIKGRIGNPGGGSALPNGAGRPIDKATAKQFYDAAGGDPKKAQALAEQNDWKVQ